jgi:hypothetical protein
VTAKSAVGTDAAANSQDFGTSRWLLSAHATSFGCRTEEALRSGIGTNAKCQPALKLSAYRARLEVVGASNSTMRNCAKHLSIALSLRRENALRARKGHTLLMRLLRERA